MSGGGESRAGILDGLAQVALARHDWNECGRVLSSALRDTQLSPYYSRWLLATDLKLKLMQADAGAALRLANTLSQETSAVEDESFRGALRLLHAEATLIAGDRLASSETVLEVARATREKALETLPRVGRMLAKLHATDGRLASASEWFEHSARMFAAAADESGRVESLEDYVGTLWPLLATGAPVSAAPPPAPACHPGACRVTVHPDNATYLGPVGTPSPASALARAVSALDLANRPQYVGGELQELLRQVAAITDAAVVSSKEGETPEILSFWGSYGALPSLLGGGEPVVRIELGRWRERDLALLLAVRPELDARIAVAAVSRLVTASLELEAARRERRERAALWPLEEAIESRHGVFVSRAMTELVATARKIGPSNATVLITGETGTGKELLARIIHDASPRAARPFIPFNCAAVPREMLDSQLFGHRRGAFTGAISNFPGVIRSAAGGTLLLDEIGEVPFDLQPKLLRFLEAQEIQPLGETQPVVVDIRVVAATNADLDQLLSSGRFREDLYYRLNVIRLRIPPLRERREEIPVLVQHFLARFAGENRKDNLRVAEETMEYLLLYKWPGNVRELLNQMRRIAALVENGAVVMPEHLAPEIAATRRTVPASARDLAPTEVVVRLDQPLAAAIEHVERAMVPWAIRAASGRVEVAANMLGLSRKGLYLKRQRLGLDAGDESSEDRDDNG